MWKKITKLVVVILLACLLLVVIYYLPPVHSRLSWRVDEWKLRIQYAINPPEAVVFVPQATFAATPTSLASPTLPPTPTPTQTPSGPTETPFPTATVTPAATPLPAQVSLQGVRYEDQHGRWNYCAPATLSMALSYWGFEGNRDVVGPKIKPNSKDKNVMPYEMVDYVQAETGLRAILRPGGNLDTLKRLIAAGYPVVVEKGVYFRDLSGIVSWMGHYEVFNGYNDQDQVFIGQDAFVGPDQRVPYDKLAESWRAFNYVYMVVFPPEKEAEVLALLGENADEAVAINNAAQKASEEIYQTSGINQFFAWYNRGTSLMLQQDYAGAAQAYDEAFKVYPSIDEKDRPWRMLWYQTGPYFAYFHSGRYYDVLSLADTTLKAIQGDKNLEESYYWRGMAKAALGDTTGAIEDYRLSLKYHPGFGPALYQLDLLGVEP